MSSHRSKSPFRGWVNFPHPVEPGYHGGPVLIYYLSFYSFGNEREPMQLRVTSLPGDGIGPEVTSQAICVLEEVATAFDHDLALDEKDTGGVAVANFGDPLPDSTIQACLASQAILLG